MKKESTQGQKYDFYRTSQGFMEAFAQYGFDTKNSSGMFIAIKWLTDIQERCMRGDKKRLDRFMYWIQNGSTIRLKKLLSEYCNENDMMHFNAFCLLDTFHAKYNLK